MRRPAQKVFLSASVFALSICQALAQSGAAYPTKPIKLIVGLPGGGADWG